MKLINRKELKDKFGSPYCTQHLTRLEAAGTFPRRLKLAAYRGGRVAWLESEILAWLEARLAQRSAPQ